MSSTPQWALERIREVREKRSDSLDLSLRPGDPREKLTEFPKKIFELRWLRILDLSGIGLSTLPEAITQLQNLTILDLGLNQLRTLPEAICQLQNLTTLDLSFNGLRTLPEAIRQLQNLKELYLRDNGLSTLPEAICQLPKLTRLSLGGNGLSTLPASITQLQKLTTLDLGLNQLRTLPEAITQLQKLTTLHLAGNGLRTLPEAITQLQNLTRLDLSFNRLRTLPESIRELQSLTSLNLIHNRLTALPEWIGLLHNLTKLDLSSNGLSTLPVSISQLQNLTELGLSGNPLVSPPAEVAERGTRAIRDYLRQLGQKGVDHLYEAKLLVLGEGGAGKTTFAHKLLDPNYQLREEETTQGVDVLKWSFPIEGDKQLQVNIWDFGGQEIYHATHQFFLTRRSLYALVADTRKDDTDFYYWLNLAELLSDNSPLLIVKNEKQDRHREINERQLKGQFECLKEVLATNLATNRDLEKAREAVKYHIKTLPHIGSPLPKTWVRVRERLEKDRRDSISLEKYLAICKENGFTATKDALQLSGYLHDIGVFLHFQEDPLLRKTVILKPKWGTDAVYKVLDNKTVIRNLGRFTRLDLETIWAEPEYENMRDELLQLMMKFRLCYEIPTQRGTYIAPQLLTENQLEYEWDEKENLLLRYTYEFMPKGILTQFIVVMHHYILGQRIVWKSGIVIEKDRTHAEVIEYYGKREILVRVAGAHKKELLTIVMHELDKIHSNFKRLKYDKLIPCHCVECKNSPEPFFHKYEQLQNLIEKGKTKVQCGRSGDMVDARGLIDDIMGWKSEKEDEIVSEWEKESATAGRSEIKTGTLRDSTAIFFRDNFLHEFETMEDNADNLRQLIEQLKTPIRVIPFVGAGFSIPLGFPGWASFLIAQAKKAGIEAKIKERIDQGEYEEAAEDLLKARGYRAFHDAITNTFGARNLMDKELKGAVAYLPHMVTGPVITTNFDRVLEEAFQQAGVPFEHEVWGANSELAYKALTQNKRFLLKIHGDAEASTDRILTKDDYLKYYGSSDGSTINLSLPLPGLLQQMLLGRQLLFLGCSLNQDRTIAVLKEVSSNSRYITHYAIVEKPASIESFYERSRFLSDHNIRPIWYPSGQHDLIGPLLAYIVEKSP